MKGEEEAVFVASEIRRLLRDPELVNRLSQHAPVEGCIHCNRCMPTIYSHTHCVVTGAPDALVTPAGIN